MNPTDENNEHHTRSELDRSLVSGVAWTAAMRWIAQGVSWAGTLIAARLLVPGDYGLVAMAMLPIGLVRMVEDFGLDAVLVQNRSLGRDIQAQLAGFALMLGAALAALFVIAAHPIAAFFNEPAVAGAIQLLCLLLIFDSLQIVPRALLQRELAFRRLAFLQLLQVCVTQSALVAAAFAGMGHRSLIFNTLAGGAVVTALLLWWKPYPVRLPRALAAISGPILQGWRLLVSRAGWYAYSNMDQTIIGRVLGRDSLGAYSFSLTFANLPVQEITSVFSRVVPGVFTEVQHDRARLRGYFLRLTEAIAFLAFPCAAGIALVADVLVALALGPQWGAVVEPLRILCLASAFTAAQILVSHILMWTGRFRANMWCSILAAAVLPLAFLAGTRYGLEGVAWAWAIAMPLVNIPSMVIAFRAIDSGFRDWLRALLPAAICTTCMAMAVVAVRFALPTMLPNWVRFAALAGTGGITYVLVLLLVYRERVWAFLAMARGSFSAAKVAPSAG